ncbi:DUF1854 domain-containing protein [Paenibacillus crassostreae]|uniref:DUF1854 domain-containing protein n=1 Tax=Paenibacillus crassostreae TaxID=1763538 RepID=A0A167AHM3_9BACL|nr:DUF1854 domain-containing protein [Paenibacillus crassostreae]AOZ92316.1 hypothetical protein LPB68_08795 [Paenibacillus crassostreae]OAB71031.1 hypothetical protein PNBC_20945 [Paenibacillus crassostreae]
MIELMRNAVGTLEMNKDGKHYSGVKLIRIFPLTMPSQYISVRSEADVEITIIEDLSGLEEKSRNEAEQELQRYYVVPTIVNIISLKRDSKEWLWEINTNYGRISFRMNEMVENLHPMSPISWLLTSTDGRRFIISDIEKLDEGSRKLWAKLH